ncbi:MAG: sugar transferase [Aggregatilineales bacterium]
MLFSPSPRRRRLQLRISERRLLLMFGDAIAVMLAVLISLFIWAQVADRTFDVEFVFPRISWFFALVVLWLLLAAANDYYQLSLAARRIASFQRLGVITVQLIFIYLIVFFLSSRDSLPRLFIIYYGISSFLLISVWRLVNPALIGWASEPRKVLIIGTDWSTETIIGAVREQAETIYEIRGIIGQQETVGQRIASIPIIGDGGDLMNFVIRDGITEIIFTSSPDLSDEIFRGVMEAYERGVVLTPMPLLYERLTGRVPVHHVKSNWALVLPISGDSLFDLYPVVGWLLDTILALIGLIAFIITLPLIALIIRLNSPGGTFYTQKRLGMNGKVFTIIKYRTMVKDAEVGTGAVFSEKGDMRVTNVGRIMRKTRLDELPQVINILRGDMSVVGPRPERPEHVVRLTEKIPFYRTRLVVRPGLTGWAQVKYAYGSTDEDAEVKLEYDLYYVRHRSLFLDLNIIVRTVGKVLRMSGV